MFLPEFRYKGSHGDDEFIQEQLGMMPWQWQKGATNKYSKVFKEKGRTAANIWLREGVKEHCNKL